MGGRRITHQPPHTSGISEVLDTGICVVSQHAEHIDLIEISCATRPRMHTPTFSLSPTKHVHTLHFSTARGIGVAIGHVCICLDRARCLAICPIPTSIYKAYTHLYAYTPIRQCIGRSLPRYRYVYTCAQLQQQRNTSMCPGLCLTTHLKGVDKRTCQAFGVHSST